MAAHMKPATIAGTRSANEPPCRRFATANSARETGMSPSSAIAPQANLGSGAAQNHTMTVPNVGTSTSSHARREGRPRQLESVDGASATSDLRETSTTTTNRASIPRAPRTAQSSSVLPSHGRNQAQSARTFAGSPVGSRAHDSIHRRVPVVSGTRQSTGSGRSGAGKSSQPLSSASRIIITTKSTDATTPAAQVSGWIRPRGSRPARRSIHHRASSAAAVRNTRTQSCVRTVAVIAAVTSAIAAQTVRPPLRANASTRSAPATIVRSRATVSGVGLVSHRFGEVRRNGQASIVASSMIVRPGERRLPGRRSSRRSAMSVAKRKAKKPTSSRNASIPQAELPMKAARLRLLMLVPSRSCMLARPGIVR